MTGRSVYTTHGVLHLERDGIIRIVMTHDSEITQTSFEEGFSAHRELAGGVKRPALVDIRGLRRISVRALRRVATDEGAEFISCAAVLVSGPVSAVLGNLFVRLGRPTFPTKLFSDESSARAWLRGYTDA